MKFLESGSARRQLGAFVAGAAIAVVSNIAVAAPTLPDPAGLAVQYDDFYSYSTRVLDYLQPSQNWLDFAGTGNLDVIITTRSSGQQNPAAYSIPDPITNPNDNPTSGTWGGGGAAGTMLVKDLYAYLLNTFGANTPVFTFDQNETGGNPNLLVTAVVEILDGAGGSVLARWAFDNTANGAAINSGANPYVGTYDPASTVTAPGEICVPIGPGGSIECFDNNVGSGKFDFIVYAPDMNLANYTGANDPGLNNVFRVSWAFSNVDDGGEEITLTGRFTGDICRDNPGLPQCNVIPEPGSVALTGLGLIGLWMLRRRRHH